MLPITVQFIVATLAYALNWRMGVPARSSVARILGGPQERVLAQIDIVEPNSLLDAWSRSLRHRWLYLNTLDTAAVRRLVAFYASEHNGILPRSALGGRTPDEVHFGEAEDAPAHLAVARKAARDERLATNRLLSCEACRAMELPANALVDAA